MNTFILNLPDSIRKIGEKLNARSSICDKAWEVLNEENEKLVYIFNRDGSLLISASGNVENGSWQYIKANKCLLINDTISSSMFSPTYLDDILLVLQKDGTDNYLILINGDQKVLSKTLDAIRSYLEEKTMSPLEKSIRKKREKEERKRREKEEEEAAYSWFKDIRG